MKKSLQPAQAFLRRIGLLNAVERVRERKSVRDFRAANDAFRAAHPDVALPADTLAYDAYGKVDWPYYYESGQGMASCIAPELRTHLPDCHAPVVLEWGCGPARVIRHLPAALADVGLPNATLIGTDYNPDSIAWSREHIPGVTFHKNELDPPLPLDAASADFIYSLSVFTHLSRDVGRRWMDELYRVLRPGGVLLFTTNSDTQSQFLLPGERRTYDTDGIVIRGRVEEGKKMFTAFHHPDFVREHWIGDFALLAHHPPVHFRFVHAQDIWIVQKTPN